ncbi:MAG: MerR family transcriptional regulator [Sphingomonadaceae bacterium]|jgi:DNA-binding transcriptional MerR regulator
MSKQSGAFLTIGELSAELNVPQHILRYWETRFPALRPLQRAGNRRYYRAEDVELVRRIHRLLNAEGYTVRGAQQALAAKGTTAKSVVADAEATHKSEAPQAQSAEAAALFSQEDRAAIIAKLTSIRAKLESVLTT